MNTEGFDLLRLTVRELLQHEAGVVSELRRRDLVRTNNKPLGDIAEQIVWSARGGVLEPNSTKSHDITARDGRRIQVKAMTRKTSGRSGMFSQFRSFDFDAAVFLVFAAETFELVAARELTPAEVKEVARYSPHANSSQPTLRQIVNQGSDVTVEMRSAYEKLCAASGGQPIA